jgi:hypothetical protein
VEPTLRLNTGFTLYQIEEFYSSDVIFTLACVRSYRHEGYMRISLR